MSKISAHVGDRIRMYRKARGLTLQDLALLIHKSRATASKYETGEINLDLDTLFDVASALQVSPNQLIDYHPPVPSVSPCPNATALNPFYQARRLYFYFYDGRQQRLKDGLIDIYESGHGTGQYEASLTISSASPTGRGGAVYYTGQVVYSDMLIRFSFVNQCNSLEEDLLYIFNPLEIRDSTHGLLCGISSADLMPCAFKCLVTLAPQDHTEEFRQQLLFTKSELRQWQKLNMLLVDNRVL